MIHLNSRDFVLSFNTDVIINRHEEEIQLTRGGFSFCINRLEPFILLLLDQLINNPMTVDGLLERVLTEFPNSDPNYFYYFLMRLSQQGFLCYSLQKDQHNKLAFLEPMTAEFLFDEDRAEPATLWRLSRFAYIHVEKGIFLLESPLSAACLWLEDSMAVRFVHALAKEQSLHELEQLIPEIPPNKQHTLLYMLRAMKAVFAVDTENKLPENREASLRQWEFHDLLFHTRSRLGRHSNLYGRTFRFLGDIELAPVVKTSMSTKTISLFVPDCEQFNKEPPLQTVLEKRESIRVHGREPLTVQQLGEFLYRTSRIKSLSTALGNIPYEMSYRLYPSGGAMYELELYLLVDSCAGLESGLYHYQPRNHQLECLENDSVQAEKLVSMTKSAAMISKNPNVLIIITARFARMQWKYESFAYAAILKHVGALYQTFYLVATAMHLAPCAIGGGDSDVFAKIAGLDYYTETSVGEFLLGSCADD